MRKLRRSLLGAAVGLAVLTGVTQASYASPTSAAQEFQNGANQGIGYGYPGVMGVVVDGSNQTYVTAGSNVRGSSTPMDPTAKFRIASNTKTFTSVVVLQLAAEGKLSLDDTVAKWLPNAVNANGHTGTNITIRDLLNQTSGLPGYIDPVIYGLYYTQSNVDVQYTPQALVDKALAQAGPQARRFKYANVNYMLAGMIIKAVTGNTPSVEVTNRLITPLNLTNTSYPESSPDIFGNYVRGWKWPPEVFIGPFRYQPPIEDATRSNTQLWGPAGAMISTLQDQTTFERALIQGQLLPPAQMNDLKTTVPITLPTDTGPQTPNRYGLGMTRWQLNCGTPTPQGPWVWSNGGDVIGYSSRWFISDDGTKQMFYVANEHHGVDDTNGKKALIESAQKAMCQLLTP